MATLTPIRRINPTPNIRGFLARAARRATDFATSLNGTPRNADASSQELEAQRIHAARRDDEMSIGEGLDRTRVPGA